MIIEDNVSTLQHLTALVQETLEDVEVRAYSTMDNVYEAAIGSRIDLFIVDIIINKDIPGDTSGITFVNRIRMLPQYEFTPVIFITSLEDPKFYAFSELHSYGYIEKPYNPDQVKELVRKAMRFPSVKKSDSTLFFRRDGVLYSIRCSDILYAESINHKMHFYRVDSEEVIIPYKTCKQVLEEGDNDNLIQCNRSVIINLQYIEYIDMSNKCIKIKGVDKIIDIGVTFQKRISRIIENGI